MFSIVKSIKNYTIANIETPTPHNYSKQKMLEQKQSLHFILIPYISQFSNKKQRANNTDIF